MKEEIELTEKEALYIISLLQYKIAVIDFNKEFGEYSKEKTFAENLIRKVEKSL